MNLLIGEPCMVGDKPYTIADAAYSQETSRWQMLLIDENNELVTIKHIHLADIGVEHGK